jgi:rhodanese-related sulfurtransferase
MTFLILSTIVFSFILYKRYFPVFGVHCMDLKDLYLDEIKVIDIRDFNESYKTQIEGAINIPFAYLNRNINEIPNRDLHLVVSNPIEKNIGIRYFRKKGFRVVGYTFVNQNKLALKKDSLKIETNFKWM